MKEDEIKYDDSAFLKEMNYFPFVKGKIKIIESPERLTLPFRESDFEGYRYSNSRISISYSHSRHISSGTPRASVDVDESLIRTLLSTHRTETNSTKQKHSLTRKSTSIKKKRKVRFNDEVIIHTIEHRNHSNTINVGIKVYVLAVIMREIWSKLDLDLDGYLNVKELNRFCFEVWESVDLESVMESYAKSHPHRGMTFHEWCTLVQDEDPNMEDFVEDLHEMFVDFGGS